MALEQSIVAELPLIPQSVAQPAAGADFTLTVPAGVWWRVVSGHATFQTQVAAATGRKFIMRNASSSPVSGTNEYWATLAETSTNINGDGVNSVLAEVLYVAQKSPSAPWFGQAQSFGAIKTYAITIPMMDIWLPPGWIWNGAVSNLAAGDQYSNIQFLIQQLSGAPASGALPLLPVR